MVATWKAAEKKKLGPRVEVYTREGYRVVHSGEKVFTPMFLATVHLVNSEDR